MRYGEDMRPRAWWTAVAAAIAACAPGQAERSAMTDAATDQRTQADEHAARRARMVTSQLRGRDITHPGVLDAMGRVPRHRFVPPGLESQAYDDNPLPIGDGQTISQPYIVALMLEAARIGPADRLLEVGSGSGYATAVASRIAARVYAIERVDSLCEEARERLAALGYADRTELRCGDGSAGWPEAAPFDAIVVSAGAPAAPEALKAQLADGGRLVLPIGADAHSQRLVRLTRLGATLFDEETLCAVRFVPLIGAQAWPDRAAFDRQGD